MIAGASLKTWALKGRYTSVDIKEHSQKTKELYTTKTLMYVRLYLDEGSTQKNAPYPRPPADGKTLWLLFKAQSGESIRRNLFVPDSALLQFGPRGSYRMETNVAYYKWIVLRTSGSDDQTLYFLD
jgi:hypothetical protein